VRDDRSVRRCARKRDADAGFQHLDPGCNFQEGGADGLEGGGTPAGFSRCCGAQIEHEPIGERMKEWMAADLSKLDLLVIQIDGIHIKEDLILLASVSGPSVRDDAGTQGCSTLFTL
jgi:hypothetical protein